MLVEIRLANDGDEQEGSQETIQCWVFVKGPKKAPELLKLELTSEQDLFFHYSKIETLESFEDLKLTQKLTLEFDGFIGLLIKLLSSVQMASDAHFTILTIQEESRAQLTFVQNLHYKFIELLQLDIQCSDEETIWESITFRYNINKAKLMYLQNNFKQFS